jgi:Cdc6-like AAA superfamily ATPase
VNEDALSPLAARLADAVSARRALDILARAGEAVPAAIARQREEAVREAEIAVIRAGAGKRIE